MGNTINEGEILACIYNATEWKRRARSDGRQRSLCIIIRRSRLRSHIEYHRVQVTELFVTQRKVYITLRDVSRRGVTELVLRSLLSSM